MNPKHTREEAIELAAKAAYDAFQEAIGHEASYGSWELYKEIAVPKYIQAWKEAAVAAINAWNQS